MSACKQPNCSKAVNARGLCSKHYRRYRLYGDPEATPRFDRDPTERFWVKVDVGHHAGCWWWTGKINNNGYGLFHVGRRSLGEARYEIAHRFAYETLVGTIPHGMQLDHLCQNRVCVNPDHLEIVTPAENTARSSSARRRHCIHGHPFTEENTYYQPNTGRRSCKTCRRAAMREYRARVTLAGVGEELPA